MVVRRELNERRGLDKKSRQLRVEQMLLRGVNNASEMAAAFAVDHSTIRADIREIMELWKSCSTPATDPGARLLRVKQMETIHHLAIEGFHRSRHDEMEISVTTKACDNSQCMHGIIKIKEKDESGHPTIRNAECPRCFGTGKIEVEVQRTKGKAGDPSFLNVAISAVKECARLEGLDPAVVSGMKRTIETAVGVDGELRERIEELFYEGPEENIVKAMALMESFELVDSKLIETTAEVTQVEEIEEPEDGGGESKPK